MENIKLGYVHVPIIPHIYTTPYHSSYRHKDNNTIQETRELTEEEKNIVKGFSIGTITILIISIIALAIAMHKLMKTY